MKHNCDGCNCYVASVYPFVFACSFSNQNRKGECPCTKCIIKMMCEEPCDGYSEFSKIAIFRAQRGE